MRAIDEGDIELAKQLIQNGADVNACDPRPLLGDHLTALHYAAFANNAELIQMLVANGADINAQTTNGQTPLYWAGANGNFAAVETLLKLGADPNIRSEIGYSPLDRVPGSEKELIRLLRRYREEL